MSTVTIPYRYKVRGGTAAAVAALNEVPLSRELVFETDTGKFKLGDGATAYNALPYLGGGDPVISQDTAPALPSDYPFWFDSSTLDLAYQYDDGNSVQWVVPGGGSGGSTEAGASASAYECWDFTRDGGATSPNVGTNFAVANSVPTAYVAGGGLAALAPSEAGHPGIYQISTGSGGTSYARLMFMPSPRCVPGGGVLRAKACLRIPTLSTAVQRFHTAFLFANQISTGGFQWARIYCVDNENSGKWRFDTADGTTFSTPTDSTVMPVAGAWTVLEIVFAADGLSVEFFIDGASIGSTTANMPTAAMTPGVFLSKSVGATARVVDVDYCEFSETFTTAR